MNHVSLFSGIGGIDLAAEWAGFRTVAFVERDKFCQQVLAKHWPGVTIWDDVCEFGTEAFADAGLRGRDGSKEPYLESPTGKQASRRDDAQRLAMARGQVDLLTGGFPCQPHSVAGKRQASADKRDLWGECARIAGELRPRWCVWENVPGLLTSESGQFFGRVLRDMESLGYLVGWCTYRASDVGALHRRERVFIVCHLADADGQRGRGRTTGSEDAADAWQPSAGAWRSDASGACWDAEPPVGRVADGVPRRVDRLRALGNAVVPQQIYPLLRAIAKHESAS